jgi:predicted MFS family arabinose efflux permease
MSSTLRRLVVARFVSEAGSASALFVGVWGVATFRLHASPGQMALSAAAWGLASIVGSLAAGVLVDRFNPRRVLIAGEIVAVPATLALVTAGSMPELISFVVPTSFSGALIATAVGSFAPFIARGDDELRRVNARLEMAFALAFVAGPAAGALIAKTAGLNWIFVANAASSVFALALIAGLRIRVAERVARAHAFLAELREGAQLALRDGHVRFVVLMGLAVWLSFGSFMALEPLFYRDVLHSGPALLGWVLTVFGGGVFAGAWLSGRVPVRVVSLRTLALLGVMIGAGEIVYTGTSHLPFVFGGNVIWGTALGAFTPLARTVVHATTPESHVGRVMGSINVAQRLGTLLPLTFVGALGAAAGVQRVLVGAGAVMIVFAFAVFPRAARVDAQPVRIDEIVTTPDEPEAATRALP